MVPCWLVEESWIFPTRVEAQGLKLVWILTPSFLAIVCGLLWQGLGCSGQEEGS